MIQTKKEIMIALLFPILALAAMALYKQSVLHSGTEVVLPITGYDPRDLLSGHYLIYRIDYGVDGICSSVALDDTAYVCLEPKVFSPTPPEHCRKLIRGRCKPGGFEAGIEKFFIPESQALSLEQKIRSKQASIVLALTRSGDTQVKDLLIEGRSWRSQ
ncbi:hypothetical protein EBZ37_02865 [bacterium]|nr:hypothetical protein [bacterium]